MSDGFHPYLIKTIYIMEYAFLKNMKNLDIHFRSMYHKLNINLFLLKFNLHIVAEILNIFLPFSRQIQVEDNSKPHKIFLCVKFHSLSIPGTHIFPRTKTHYSTLIVIYFEIVFCALLKESIALEGQLEFERLMNIVYSILTTTKEEQSHRC